MGNGVDRPVHKIGFYYLELNYNSLFVIRERRQDFLFGEGGGLDNEGLITLPRGGRLVPVENKKCIPGSQNRAREACEFAWAQPVKVRLGGLG